MPYNFENQSTFKLITTQKHIIMETNNSADNLQTSSNTIFERITQSIALKMLVIFFLVLIMLIPISMVGDLISERENRKVSVTNEIALKWGGEQVISSPILAVPYTIVKSNSKKDAQGKDYIVETIESEYAFLLPNQSDFKTTITPNYLERGIFKSVVYNSQIDIVGQFGQFDLAKMQVSNMQINWNEAKLLIGVHHIKGLTVNPILKINGKNIPLDLATHEFKIFPNTLSASIELNQETMHRLDFSISYQLRGSASINYLPLADQSNIQVQGEWQKPSFTGGYLPNKRNVENSKFSAYYSIPSFNRKIPKQWNEMNSPLYSFSGRNLDRNQGHAEGGNVKVTTWQTTGDVISDMDMVQIKFLADLNSYDKVNRAVKYGILIIMLTFVSLLFTEIIKKERIHIIQYVFIGLAMVLFYSLLLAISEQLGFNLAYVISSLATIVLVSAFILMITNNKWTALMFTSIIGIFYIFIYVLMQIEDYSLLAGTIGVFIILAVLMKLSTKIDWYKYDRK